MNDTTPLNLLIVQEIFLIEYYGKGSNSTRGYDLIVRIYKNVMGWGVFLLKHMGQGVTS